MCKCKLVGCVVVTEEEQNKLLMGVGLAGGSGSHLENKPTAATVQYSTVVEYTKVHVHDGIRNFVHFSSVSSLSPSLSLFGVVQFFIPSFSFIGGTRTSFFYSFIRFIQFIQFISICFLFVVLSGCSCSPQASLVDHGTLSLSFLDSSSFSVLSFVSSPSLGAIEW